MWNQLPNVAKMDLPQLNGVIAINKPAGPSSAQCLNALKRLGQKKIGHAGTLDPMARGVLIVLLGQATKIAAHLQAAGKKIYRGRLRLGIETDTWDMEGSVINEASWHDVDTADIAAAIDAWRGVTRQEVPPYSAAKHNGQPLYKLARKGAVVPRKEKEISVYEAGALEDSLPHVSFRVVCGSGTYIRSLAHSLGKRLGCGAALCELTREYSHPFDLAGALELDAICADPDILAQCVLPLDMALPEWPKIDLDEARAQSVRHGQAQRRESGEPKADRALLMASGKPVALARLAGGYWIIERGLWT